MPIRRASWRSRLTLVYSWRGCGHRPLVTSLRSVWKPWRKRAVAACRQKQASAPYGEEEVVKLRQKVKSSCVGPPLRARLPVLRSVGDQVSGAGRRENSCNLSPSETSVLRMFFPC